jgi:hypothetical protein
VVIFWLPASAEDGSTVYLEAAEDYVMQRDPRNEGRKFVVLAAVIVALSVVAVAGRTKRLPKVYDEDGKIVATSLNRYMVKDTKKYTHTYTVLTDSKRYLLDCDKKPGMFSTTGEECGPEKQRLKVGEAIQFRMENGWAYISTPEPDNPSAEQRLKILSEDIRTDANSAATQAAPAQKPSDAKP